jgi:hypothetical protein
LALEQEGLHLTTLNTQLLLAAVVLVAMAVLVAAEACV